MRPESYIIILYKLQGVDKCLLSAVQVYSCSTSSASGQGCGLIPREFPMHSVHLKLGFGSLPSSLNSNCINTNATA